MESFIFKSIATAQSGAESVQATPSLVGNSEKIASLFADNAFFSFLNTVWSGYAIIAYIFCIFMLVLYVYASVRKKSYDDLQTQKLRDAEQMYNEKYNGVAHSSRLKDVFAHIESENPNDWKLAIIEADIILDDTLKQKGYLGSSLGERLKSISSGQLESLNDAWEAHKVRNRIAHDGADFVLTKRIAQDTIVHYQKVFSEFGVN